MTRQTTIRRIPALAALLAAAALLGGAGHAAQTTATPGGLITFADCCGPAGGAETGASTAANPYPSVVTVSGTTGNITEVKVTIVLDHQFPDDVDLLLVNPSGTTKVLLMSDVGNNLGNGIGPDTLMFSSTGVAFSTTSQIADGTYLPTNSAGDCDNNTDADAFPAPAPQTGYTTALTAFNNAPANGDWKLYAVDDCNLGNTLGASIASWTLDITSGTTSVAVRSFTATSIGRGVQLRWRTGTEASIIGFDVYRVVPHKAIAKVNRRLIAAKRSGTSLGASYTLVDRAAFPRAGVRYRLRLVGLDGKRSWASSTAVRAAAR